MIIMRKTLFTGAQQNEESRLTCSTLQAVVEWGRVFVGCCLAVHARLEASSVYLDPSAYLYMNAMSWVGASTAQPCITCIAERGSRGSVSDGFKGVFERSVIMRPGWVSPRPPGPQSLFIQAPWRAPPPALRRG